MLVDVHPDVSRLVWKFQRHHHEVDYSQWKTRKLLRDPSVQIPDEINNYGMALRPVKEQEPK